MKLAYCKFNTESLKEEVFKMNRFNIASTMRKLVGAMGLMFLGMTIPMTVFKSCDYMLTSYGRVANFTGGITSTFKVSSLFLVCMAKYMAMFLVLMAAFKFITSGDIKRFGKDIASIFIGYVIVELSSFIPMAIPNLMRYMGYL